jgi:DNA 3'-phosphatase
MWTYNDSLWTYAATLWVPGRPLALFDFDSTLHPCRGKGPGAALSSALLAALGVLGGRNVVIFSNRTSASFGALQALRDYVELVEAAGGSVDVYAATARDRNRKPQRGAWEHLCASRGVALTPFQRAASFYCGDAAGRASDFSTSDRGFATNIGIRFCVPEQIFGAHNLAKGVEAGTILASAPPLSEVWSIEAELAAAASPARQAHAEEVLAAVAEGYDVVLLTGSPAGGKSTFARRLAAAGPFSLVSRDIQGCNARCKSFVSAELAKPGQKVIIDNTNRSGELRRSYIDAARKARPESRVAIVWVATPQKVCAHLDGLRCDSDPSGATRLLPRPVIPGFWKHFEEPDGEWQGPPADQTGGAYPSWVWEGAQELYTVEFAYAPGTPATVTEKRYI